MPKINGTGFELRFAVGEITDPHMAESLVKSQRLGLRPHLKKRFTPLLQGSRIRAGKALLSKEYAFPLMSGVLEKLSTELSHF